MLVDQWFPFFDVSKTLEEMDRVFDHMGRPLGLRSVPRGTFPAVNVYQQGDAVVLKLDMPGVARENVDLTVDKDTLTIVGKAERAKPRKIRIAAAE